MRKLALCAAFALSLFGGCGDTELPPDDVDTDQSALMCYPSGCPKPGMTVDCRTAGDASCYECGNPNGVMCCFGTCTVIPAQKFQK